MEQTRIMRTGFVVSMTGLVMAVMLTACGGGRGGNGNGNDGVDSGGSNGAFIDKISSVVTTTPDNTEPELTDAIVATSSDTTEPVTVVF